MKIFYTYIYFFTLLMAGCQTQKKQLPPLNETFKRDDRKPFGSYVAYHHFKKLFTERFVETNTEPFDDAWKNMKEYSTGSHYSLYVLVTKNLEVSYSEAKAMVSYVKEGNDLFISADYIDKDLLDQINCTTDRYDEVISEVKGIMHDTWVKMFFGKDFSAQKYGYYYYPFLNSFANYDTTFARVLGVNEINKPNYIILFIGRGRLYLHAAPRAFSNYFLLTHNNYEYLENVLSYLRFEPKNIFWDEYYKNKINGRHKHKSDSGSGSSNDDEKNKFSSFNVINKHPSLLWAFWLSIIAILLYVLFNIKRKQRVIPEIKQNVNTSVVFTETVGRLYLEKKNNKNISEKMITYFYEHIRNKYFLNTNQVNDEFINTLSRKSGMDIDKTQQLFTTINKVKSEEEVSDTDLLSLNGQIQNFYKNKN